MNILLIRKMLLLNLFLVCLTTGLSAAKWQKVTQDNWILDKINDSSVEISGSKLNRLAVNYTRFTGTSMDNFNALYLGIVANETKKRYYWEFTCVKNCKTVGIAKKDNFYSDNRTIKGAFFHHNLQNNLDLLVQGFGDGIKDGDRIGFILDVGEQELKIYIVQNDRPLGLAYVQKAPYAHELYPAVLTGENPGIVEINEKNDVSTDHLLVRGDYPVKSVRGDYKLDKATVNGTVKELKEKHFLQFRQLKDDTIWVQVHVGSRSWSGRILKMGKDAEGDIYEFRFDIIMPYKFHFYGDDESEDVKTVYRTISTLKRMKFSDEFDQLTIISERLGITLLYKRFVREMPYHETSDLLA